MGIFRHQSRSNKVDVDSWRRLQEIEGRTREIHYKLSHLSKEIESQKDIAKRCREDILHANYYQNVTQAKFSIGLNGKAAVAIVDHQQEARALNRELMELNYSKYQLRASMGESQETRVSFLEELTSQIGNIVSWLRSL
ncbi:MAG: hypothetical protein AAGJ35_03250 [Myxococcota bacterium]